MYSWNVSQQRDYEVPTVPIVARLTRLSTLVTTPALHLFKTRANLSPGKWLL